MLGDLVDGEFVGWLVVGLVVGKFVGWLIVGLIDGELVGWLVVQVVTAHQFTSPLVVFTGLALFVQPEEEKM